MINLKATYEELDVKQVLAQITKPLNVAKILAGLGAGYWLFKTAQIYARRRRYSHIPGPSTSGILGFYTGNLKDLNEMLKQDKLLADLFLIWHEKYGDIFKFQLGSKVFLLTCDRDAIKEIYVTSNFPKSITVGERAVQPCGERFLGAGILSEMNLDDWRARRGIFNHGFHRNVLMTFNDHFNSVVNSLLEKLRKQADGKTYINLFKELNKATLDAIALIAFGMNIDAVNDDDCKLNTYLAQALSLVDEILTDPFLQWKPWRYREIRKIKGMIRYVRTLGRAKILERVNAFRNNEYMPDDILTSILKNFKDENMDLEKMVDDFVTFFIAGQETTANSLAFTFLAIGRDPRILAKAREEIDRVLGEKSSVTYLDVNELKYCTAIFKETLRLFPPVAMTVREVTKEITIDGYKICPGSNVFVSTYINGRNEKNFKDPLEYRPERFLKGDTQEAFENFVYFPFSVGPRNCIGQNFALMEGVITIARFLQTFDFKLDPTQSSALESKLTLRPKDGCRCSLTLRA